MTSDVVFHRNILKLLSYLIQNAKTKSKLEAEYKELAENSHELLTHCLVVLNIIQHLIEATTPISQAPKSQVDQTSITNPRLVKFVFSKETTKIEKNFTVDLTIT